MFKVGDKIVYGKNGVCEVVEITQMSLSDDSKKELYYNLKPIYQQGSTIYTPAENGKIAMRAVINKEEAEKLIELIPKIKAEPIANSNKREMVEIYENALSSQDPADLAELTKSIYAKKQIAEQNKKNMGAVDEKFMKKAEEMLFGEHAVALGIEKDDVPEYIAKKIEK